MTTHASLFTSWAEHVPELGPAVYRLTQGPKEHKHGYHLFCPWSEDGRRLLLLRYVHAEPEAEICLLDTGSGQIEPVAETRKWNAHDCANQQWLKHPTRICFFSADESGDVVVTIRPDGSGRKILSTAGLKMPAGREADRWAYGTTPLAEMFPDDKIAARHDKGLTRVNLETGEREFLLSLEQILERVPNSGRIADLHLSLKTTIAHTRLPRMLFGVTNTFWAVAGLEPKVNILMSMSLDGSDPAYVGNYRNHPNWHPSENLILSNIADCNDNLRFGLFDGNGQGLPHYIPDVRGGGHPSFSPDGKWICTDTAGTRPENCGIILCRTSGGPAIMVMDGYFRSEGHASFNAVRDRAPGMSVMDALQKPKATNRKTQAHPAWSRDGSAILFNRDCGEGSQLYMIDVAHALTAAT